MVAILVALIIVPFMSLLVVSLVPLLRIAPAARVLVVMVVIVIVVLVILAVFPASSPSSLVSCDKRERGVTAEWQVIKQGHKVCTNNCILRRTTHKHTS